jgi:hypothetical protein
MDRKATVNGSDRGSSPAQALAHDVAGIAHDVAAIADLQMRLFTLDLRSMRAGLARGASAWMAAYVVLLTALPVGLAGCGLWVAEVTNLTPAGGLVVAAVVALALVAGLAAFGRQQFKAQQTAFENSRKELAENLAAVKQVISDYAGSSSRNE